MAEAKIVTYKNRRPEVSLTGDPDLLEKFKEAIPRMSRTYMPDKYRWRVDYDMVRLVRELFVEEGIEFQDLLA